jgi:hypothetical protein
MAGGGTRSIKTITIGSWFQRPPRKVVKGWKGALYIRAMRKKLSNWRVIRIRGNKAELVGTVPAADEKSAIKAAIKEYKIDNPDQQRRLAGRPDE